MLEQIKILLDIEDNLQDNKLNIYINLAVESIKNYLNNDKIDKNYIIENYSVAIIELVYKAFKGKDTNNIKQMSQGSRSVTYKDATGGFTITEDIAVLLPTPFIKLM